MTSSFPLDLRVARRASGLTQSDCAFLLSAHRSKISHLECGNTVPSLRDICLLSVIYDTSFESLFDDLLEEVQGELQERLEGLPEAPQGWRGRLERENTLKRLRALSKAANSTGYDIS